MVGYSPVIYIGNEMPKLAELKLFEDLSNSIKTPIVTDEVKDKFEINRGKAYAFFPELIDSATEISITNFKELLKAKGISDNDFQEKILTMILQNRVGIHFGIMKYISVCFLPENGDIPEYSLPQDKISMNLEVIDSEKIEFHINSKVTLTSDDNTEIANINILLTITPDDVLVNHFKVETLNKSQEAQEVYELLKLQEDGLLQRIINWFKRLLGLHIKNEIHPNLSLEKTSP